MQRWIEVLVRIARSRPERFPVPEFQEEVLADYEEARSVYRSIQAEAERLWGDG
jgi:hypothetical protein